MRQYLLLILLFSFSIPESFATIYKWTDERGVITYSQHKSGSSALKTERIAVKSTPSTTGAKKIFCEERDSEPSKSTGAPTTDKQSIDSAQKKVNAEAINEICQSARQNLIALQRSGNVLYKDGSGNFMRLTEQDKDQKRKEANGLIKEFCQ